MMLCILLFVFLIIYSIYYGVDKFIASVIVISLTFCFYKLINMTNTQYICHINLCDKNNKSLHPEYVFYEDENNCDGQVNSCPYIDLSKYKIKKNNLNFDKQLNTEIPQYGLFDLMGSDGDNAIAKKMSQVSNKNKLAVCIKSKFGPHCLKKYFEEELRDYSNSIWWENQDLEANF